MTLQKALAVVPAEFQMSQTARHRTPPIAMAALNRMLSLVAAADQCQPQFLARLGLRGRRARYCGTSRPDAATAPACRNSTTSHSQLSSDVTGKMRQPGWHTTRLTSGSQACNGRCRLHAGKHLAHDARILGNLEIEHAGQNEIGPVGEDVLERVLRRNRAGRHHLEGNERFLDRLHELGHFAPNPGRNSNRAGDWPMRSCGGGRSSSRSRCPGRLSRSPEWGPAGVRRVPRAGRCALATSSAWDSKSRFGSFAMRVCGVGPAMFGFVNPHSVSASTPEMYRASVPASTSSLDLFGELSSGRRRPARGRCT